MYVFTLHCEYTFSFSSSKQFSPTDQGSLCLSLILAVTALHWLVFVLNEPEMFFSCENQPVSLQLSGFWERFSSVKTYLQEVLVMCEILARSSPWSISTLCSSPADLGSWSAWLCLEIQACDAIRTKCSAWSDLLNDTLTLTSSAIFTASSSWPEEQPATRRIFCGELMKYG